MILRTLFRRRPPIDDRASLAEFIDANAAFLVQKGIYEYARARAGHYAKVLFQETGFRDAVEQSRWRAYPLGLAMVTELVVGVLSPHDDGTDRQRNVDAVGDLALSVFDRYPVPGAVGTVTWSDLRVELTQRLARIALHPPKPAMDIPEPFAEAYFKLMPIHEKLRGRDFFTTRNYLRVTMCNIHDDLTKRMDVRAVVTTLLTPAA